MISERALLVPEYWKGATATYHKFAKFVFQAFINFTSDLRACNLRNKALIKKRKFYFYFFTSCQYLFETYNTRL